MCSPCLHPDIYYINAIAVSRVQARHCAFAVKNGCFPIEVLSLCQDSNVEGLRFTAPSPAEKCSMEILPLRQRPRSAEMASEDECWCVFQVENWLVQRFPHPV
ncbi:hypothetical protein HPB47_006765 [Ixodes persulcatus]|uniref:Uncharacterized protein n=1 Tax=Ixodes persulcatus TaxID=34615 RepID=A0AC60P9E3_IXOPE|nr:hypothetical protein HPB47_006765 [Ixodes persulcatus]